MRINHTNEISKPPEIVFPWIADPKKAMQWQKDVKGEEIIINRPEVIGTTFKEEIGEGGNRLEMNGVITEYVVNKLIGFHLESKIHELDVRYSIEEINQNSKVSVDTIINWKFPVNIISLFIGKKMKKDIIRQMEAEILELKRICETE